MVNDGDLLVLNTTAKIILILKFVIIVQKTFALIIYLCCITLFLTYKIKQK